jgi:hypothetical protein
VDVRAEKKVRVAINGFGRIGRNFLRCWEGRSNSLLDVVAINDSGGVKQASHLLKYDSTLGKFDADVKIVDDSTLAVNGKNIKVVSSRDPTQLPWKEMNIDLVIEGTGVFLDTPGAGKHLQVRARAEGVPPGGPAVGSARLPTAAPLRSSAQRCPGPSPPCSLRPPPPPRLAHPPVPNARPRAGRRQEGADHRPRQGL